MKKGPKNVFFLGFMSGMRCSSQLCGDYFTNHYKDHVFKQPGFNGKYPSFFFFVAHFLSENG